MKNLYRSVRWNSLLSFFAILTLVSLSIFANVNFVRADMCGDYACDGSDPFASTVATGGYDSGSGWGNTWGDPNGTSFANNTYTPSNTGSGYTIDWSNTWGSPYGQTTLPGDGYNNVYDNSGIPDTGHIDYGNCGNCGYSNSTPYSYSAPANQPYSYSTPYTYSNPTFQPFSYYTPTYSQPTYQQPPTQTTVVSNTDNSNCKSGNCGNSVNNNYNNPVNNNTNNNNVPVTVTIANPAATQAAPVQQVVYQQPVQQPVYQQPTYQPAYHYNPPVAYNNPGPYVALSKVPYTGLDLGPFGTVIYWSILVLAALIGAYLIAVKKVHNDIAASLKSFLFGTKTANVVKTQTVSAPSVSPAPVQTTSGMDEFIFSQINRARA